MRGPKHTLGSEDPEPARPRLPSQTGPELQPLTAEQRQAAHADLTPGPSGAVPPEGLEVFGSDRDLEAPLEEAAVLHQVREAMDALWRLEQERAGVLRSLSEARGALAMAQAELNALWNEHRQASLADRPGILGRICRVNLRVDALWTRIQALGG